MAPDVPVSRARYSAFTKAEIDHAFQNLVELDQDLADAGESRQYIDLIWGAVLTRYLTMARFGGFGNVRSAGRVQTPTLALVVNRDREIAAFTSIDYLVLQATLQHDAGTFSAIFKPSETQPGLDSEGRLIDGATAQGIMDAVRGKNGIITSVTREKKKKPVSPCPIAFPRFRRPLPPSSA